MGVLYVLSDVASFFLYHIVGYRKKVVRENLKNAFPAKSQEEINRITREFYTRFTDYAVETLKILDMETERLKDHVEFEFDKEFLDLIEHKRPSLLLVSHQFNWELTIQAMRVHLQIPIEVAYKRLSNKAFDEYMIKSRTHAGATIIEKSLLVKHVIRTRSEFKVLGLLADQRPPNKSTKYWTTFLHQETAFVRGPDILGKLMNVPVFMFFIERQKRGFYKVRVASLTQPPYEKEDTVILDAYVDGLEKIIQKDPAGYLWSHKRWKNKREDDVVSQVSKE